MIPNNIIQFWDNLDEIPEILQECMRITRENNPSTKIIVADDEYMKSFITQHYNKTVSKLYEKNKIPASRSDLARLMLLYEYGGFYVDTSFELNGALADLVDGNADVVLVQRDDFPQYKDTPEHAHVMNGIIGVKPKSELIKWSIQHALGNLISGETNIYVYIATGPIVLNQAWGRYNHLLNIQTLSFKALNKKFFYHRRVKGVSNTWTQEQFNGMIAPDYYRSHGKQYEKSFSFMNRLFYFTFHSLRLK